jgi:hypothetical protein
MAGSLKGAETHNQEEVCKESRSQKDHQENGSQKEIASDPEAQAFPFKTASVISFTVYVRGL